MPPDYALIDSQTQIALSIRIIWVQIDCGLITIDGFIQVSLRFIDLTQVIVRIGVFSIDSDAFFESFF